MALQIYEFSLTSMGVVSSALQSQGIPVIQYTLEHLEGKKSERSALSKFPIMYVRITLLAKKSFKFPP